MSAWSKYVSVNRRFAHFQTPKRFTGLNTWIDTQEFEDSLKRQAKITAVVSAALIGIQIAGAVMTRRQMSDWETLTEALDADTEAQGNDETPISGTLEAECTVCGWSYTRACFHCLRAVPPHLDPAGELCDGQGTYPDVTWAADKSDNSEV